MKTTILVSALCLTFLGCAPKHDELKRELAVMKAAIQTGINQPDFNERFIQLRAARSLCELNDAQDVAFKKVDQISETCLYFWKEKIHGSNHGRSSGSVFVDVSDESISKALRVGVILNPQISGWDDGRLPLVYRPADAINDLFSKLSDAINQLMTKL